MHLLPSEWSLDLAGSLVRLSLHACGPRGPGRTCFGVHFPRHRKQGRPGNTLGNINAWQCSPPFPRHLSLKDARASPPPRCG
jgi:hypothetical protein